ncbi:DUF2207 family protein [Desulfurobacterium indicum]|uniref:DUF2207 domain-containing protein n=1 Tax=Desulfurobacterium indicum TaxID=1914305 RepID=A0A1R1MJX9_9BACT|nr:DUF2207 domain-containing protein [Desulfurobacterium indicum]OMH40069.1 hypothetical protein BLW93_07270 [Desulfurobacterium indicum]
MTEKRYFGIAVALSFLLSLLVFFDFRSFFSSLLVNYTADITIGNTVSIRETFDYFVKKSDKYSMLFRNWKVPLTFNGEELNNPYITVESLNSAFPWYVVDYKRRVYLKVPDKVLASICKIKAYRNEVGIVKGLEGNNLKKFDKGIYSFSAFYRMYPPVETDGKFSHINIKLADVHVYYSKVKIFLKDPKHLIERLYVHMPHFSVKKLDNGYFIKGKSPSDSLVELEMVLKGNPVKGFYRRVFNVSFLAEKANFNPFVFLIKLVDKLIFVSILVFPIFMIYYYERFGSESSDAVPEYISFIPDKEKKPYVVNLLFSGDATVCDENAFYATLLDMQRRGLIDIRSDGNGIIIEILSMTTEDPYELSVLSFLERYAEDIGGKKIFIPERLEVKVKELTNSKSLESLKSMKEDFDSILRWNDDSIVNDYLDLRGYNLFSTVAVILIVLLVLFSATVLIKNDPLIDTTSVVAHCAVLIGQLLIFLFLPPQILGRWKERRYRESLLWKGFKNFLSNMAMIKKYAPEDISIWKEWLIYGTALGVADKVEKAMKELNVDLPDVDVERRVRTHFSVVYAGIGSGIASLSKSSSGGDGGFGAGGGFGGGGAGGR